MQTNANKLKQQSSKPRKSWQDMQAGKGKEKPVRDQWKREAM